MKATGIVRRIDDLGRVVIPKEIRRTLRIKEGDPLEIFTDREGEIILKKYSPIGELSAFAREYAEALAATSGHSVCITDRDQVVAAAGNNRKEYAGKAISRQLENLIQNRDQLLVSQNRQNCIAVTVEEKRRRHLRGHQSDFKRGRCHRSRDSPEQRYPQPHGRSRKNTDPLCRWFSGTADGTMKKPGMKSVLWISSLSCKHERLFDLLTLASFK